MGKYTYDERNPRPFPLFSPAHRHLLLLLGWVAYLLSYCLTEAWIDPKNCTPIHCFVDDWIPFCEWFLIPYVLWYGLIAFSLLYFLLHNVESFRRLQWYFIVLQFCATVIYILFPNRQDLRPSAMPRENPLTYAVAYLYRLDTNTNVCPSLHVGCSVAIASVWLKTPGVSRGAKGAIVALSALICLSTVFLKQHSVLDGFAAMVLCMGAEWLLFSGYYRRKVCQSAPY